MEQQIPPYRAHDGEWYPRPPGASADHIPVWHRFVDVLTGQLCEHISHWLVDVGPAGYLSETHPIDTDGNDIGQELPRCFCCGVSTIMVKLTFYRRDGAVILIRCQDDPAWDEPNRDTNGNG
jgi:hypothetical protein